MRTTGRLGEIMLTTTIDGLWVLQVLSGIEVLAPELGLRPHLPSVEAKQTALEHPVAAELRAAGAITEHFDVDEPVLEWLTVLARRDIGLLMYSQRAAGTETERVLLARFDRWWVALERCGLMVRIGAAGSATSETSAARLIESQIERLCGSRAAAPIRPVVLQTENLIAMTRDGGGLRALRCAADLDPDQWEALAMAADGRRCDMFSLVGLQSGVGSAAVTIHDTPRGRLLSEQVDRDGISWMVLAPGSPATVATAVNAMMRRLPASEHWHSHRKVV